MENLRASWESAYSLFWSKFDNCFVYTKTAIRARDYVRGLMSGIERKNGWQLAEYIGDEAPYAVQNFLSRAIWDADMARDHVYLAPRCQGEFLLFDTFYSQKVKPSSGFPIKFLPVRG